MFSIASRILPGNETSLRTGCSVAFDVVSIVVLPLILALGGTGILTLTPAAYWIIGSVEGVILIVAAISWGRLCCQKRLSYAEKAAAWEGKFFFNDKHSKERITRETLEALNKLPDQSDFQLICFFTAIGTKSDMFFEDGDGNFQEVYPLVKDTQNRALFVICPQDEQVHSRWWNDSGYFSCCATVQPKLKDVKNQCQVFVLSKDEALLWNGGTFPKRLASFLSK